MAARNKKEKKIGRWTVVKKLGQGAYGIVYMVHEQPSEENPGVEEQMFALKKIQQSDIPRKAKKITREISILKVANHHPNCVKLFEVTNSNRHFHLLMECCAGGTLFDAIIAKTETEQMPLFSQNEAKMLTRQIMEALEYLHSKDIAHRDLKPENILFADEARTQIKIADFGLSKAMPQDEDGHTKTALKTRVGTLNYIAPEVLHKGVKTYGFKCDIWSVGIILYVMFCGYYPYGQDNQDALLRSIVKRPICFPADEWKHTTKETRDFIRQLCSKDPLKRLSSAQSLVHPWLSGKGTVKTKFPVTQISNFLNRMASDLVLNERESVIQDLKMEFNLTQAHARKFVKKYKQKLLDVVKLDLQLVYDLCGVIHKEECVEELKNKFGLDPQHAEEQVQEFCDRYHPLEDYVNIEDLNMENVEEWLNAKFDYFGIGLRDGHIADHEAGFEGDEEYNGHRIEEFNHDSHFGDIVKAFRSKYHTHIEAAEQFIKDFRTRRENDIRESYNILPTVFPEEVEAGTEPQNITLKSYISTKKPAAEEAGAGAAAAVQGLMTGGASVGVAVMNQQVNDAVQRGVHRAPEEEPLATTSMVTFNEEVATTDD